MVSTWIAEAAARGDTHFVYFADRSDKSVLESFGFTCEDEYVAYEVPARVSGGRG